MSSPNKYAEIALSGKWIKLARCWLNDNCPCSRQTMFTELGMLMPQNIRDESRLRTREAMVRSAFSRLYNTSSIPDVIEKPPLPKERPPLGGATGEIRKLLASNKIVTSNDIKHLKNGGSLIGFLVKRGECFRISPGVFSRSQGEA